MRHLGTVLGTYSILALAPLPCLAQARETPPELKAVLEYLQDEEYPELVDSTHYRVRVANAEIADLDGDGRREVLLHVHPHYRQSPTILIFQIDSIGKARRVAEGLAPGRVIPVSGDYLDSHELGSGMDLTADGPPENASKVVRAALQRHLHVVQYREFLHVDARKGKGGYVDMRAHPEIASEKTCASFEFPTVEEIAVGKVGADLRPVLAVAVGGDLFYYRIEGITPEGLLNKHVFAGKKPVGFSGFVRLPGGGLAYVDHVGQQTPLPALADER